MYVKGTHNCLEEPPHAAMFRRQNKDKKSGNTEQSSIMFSVVDKLCIALTSKPATPVEKRSTFSPMKRAELRSTYIKQLGDLKQLQDNGILSNEEYEEQRVELVQQMRLLRGSPTDIQRP